MANTKRSTYILFTNQDHQPSSLLGMKISGATRHFILRLTGGCGYMDPIDGKRNIDFLTETLSGFGGVLLHGGTRIYQFHPENESYEVFPTILEVPPVLWEKNHDLRSVGIVPKMKVVEYHPELGLIVSKDDEHNQITTIHPNLDACLIIQRNVDQKLYWDAEWQECERIISAYLEHGGDYKTMLISSNGGETTKKEIERWATDLKWPVLLIKGSGRVTDELARNRAWLRKHPTVSICSSVSEARDILTKIGALS